MLTGAGADGGGSIFCGDVLLTTGKTVVDDDGMRGCELILWIHLFIERFIHRPGLFKGFDLGAALGTLHNHVDHARRQESPVQQQQQPSGCGQNAAEVEKPQHDPRIDSLLMFYKTHSTVAGSEVTQ